MLGRFFVSLLIIYTYTTIMKLHLPKKLLRAVMAIFVAQTAFSTTWGEEAQISNITITSDATYGNEDPVYDKSTWHIDVSRDIHITDTQKNTHSLSFDGANGAITDTAIEAGNITVDALKYFSIKNVAIEGFCTGAGMHVPYSKAKITLTNIGSTADADAIVISGNSIHADDDNVLGGAMYGEYIEIMNTTGNIKVSNNAVSSNGEGCAVNSGGIVGEQLISIHDNDDIYFSGNSAIGHGNTCGGAICALAPSGTSLNIEKNGDVVFSGNSVSGNNFTVGGAIGALSDVIIKGNNSISFTENKGVYSNVIYGGAIFSLVGVQISENKAADSTAVSVDFSGNSLSGVSSAFGGAISATIDSTEGLIETQSTGHDVKLENNGNINFSDNSIETVGRGRGGAIYADNHVALADNAGITFAGNNITTKEIGSAVGGAIAANFSQTSQTPIDTSSVSVTGNTGKISFENNTVTAEQWTAHGGAIYSAGQLTLQGNKKEIVFEGNKAIADIASDASGGAIMTVGKTLITENEGNISFADNTVSSQGGNAGGGAIIGFGTGVSITDNIGTVTFSGNKVEGVSWYAVTSQNGDAIEGVDKLILGGAIASFSAVDVSGNGLVAFSGNTVADSFVESINTTDADSMDFGTDYVVTAGGAIASLGSINLTGNNGLTIEKNQVQSYGRTAVGGALAAFDTVNISDNTGAVKVSVNSLGAQGYVETSGNGYSVYNSAFGGAIYAQQVIFDGNTAGVEVSGNSLVNNWGVYGGAIAADGGVTLRNNGAVAINNNKAESEQNVAYGGAIYSTNDVIVDNNDSVSFLRNSAISASNEVRGGAIHSEGNVLFDNNSSVEFSENLISNKSTSGSYGAAISSKGSVTFVNNGDIKFDQNAIDSEQMWVYAYSMSGGAIYAADSVIIGEEGRGNGNVTFSGNSIINSSDRPNYVQGGAIEANNGVSISYNENVSFIGNFVNNEDSVDGFPARGGAIYSEGFVEISNNTGKVLFQNNKAEGCDMGATGGAIHSQGSVALFGNKDGISFEGNQTRGLSSLSAGAAINIQMYNSNIYDVLIGLNGDVSFSNNTSLNDSGLIFGGAIQNVGGTTHISYNNGDVTFTDNGTGVQNEGVALGGAILTAGLSIVGNAGDVTFAGNFESCVGDSQYELYSPGGTFLRSIFVYDGRFELAAEEGKSITFYDSIYVAANNEMAVLNGYGDALNDGNVKVSTGDIIFSGARTEQDLATVQEYLKSQNFEAAASNVQASRTSVIERDVLLAAGSLQVKDGAVLRVGTMDGTKGNMLYLIDGQREGANLGIAYPEGHMPELVVSAGSRIEAGSITFDSNTVFTVTGASSSIEYAATFSVREAALVAELQADTVTLTGGMTYTQEGAYTLMVGDSNKLIIDVSNGLAFTLNLDASVAYTEGEMTYFVLFTGVEMPPELVGADSWDQVGVNYNLGGNYTAPTMGYDEATGTLYVSAKSSTIPEPTTATLSLLALAALAARRRRK